MIVLLKRSHRKFGYHLRQLCNHRRDLSIVADTTNITGLPRCVYLSKSNNIFENLALEDWIYENTDFEKQNVLLLWRNEPTVVVGRHQNPWKECNVFKLQNLSVHLARRKSGGGTVYHDLGNLNCTFFTTKTQYNRDRNLLLVAKAVNQRWGLDLAINERDDIVMNGKYKVSGTAAKLGRKSAYHHFTLLYNTNLDRVHQLLHIHKADINSTATDSVKSSVQNLCCVEPSIDFESLTEAVAREYLHNAQQQENITELDPTDESRFPGIEKIRESLENWQWVYGKTPAFHIQRTRWIEINEKPCQITLNIHFSKGSISDVKFESPEIQISQEFKDIFLKYFKGVRMRREDLEVAIDNFQTSGPFHRSSSLSQFIVSVLLDTLTDRTAVDVDEVEVL
ncbi:lipoyltransferase 1, mitochondrial isoform X2 [Lingula anatina]|nr:lipoyltransferase 1, mitochondrial isoform X2 [Lingula anatina]XP_013413162.1 lipoyltransferase 1, mitochondrial isoform X2 [Lingula anatina]|eukprot:XP_013413155.1 lipoyltransferase 1, mitochondrial isoform X2 [Lingula anatina]